MKVRIIKATPYRWYDDQIGMIVNVVDMGETYFGFSTGSTTHYIHKSDCEILPEENQPEPFDLERALRGDKVITRSGYEVTEMHLFKTDSSAHNLCVIINSCSYWYDEKGVFNLDHFGDMNLLMAPRESEYVTKWVNLYAAGCAAWEHSQQEAIDSNVKTGYLGHIGTFPITFKRPS